MMVSRFKATVKKTLTSLIIANLRALLSLRSMAKGMAETASKATIKATMRMYSLLPEYCIQLAMGL